MDDICKNLSTFQYRKGTIRPTRPTKERIQKKASMFPSSQKWRNSTTSRNRSKSALTSGKVTEGQQDRSKRTLQKNSNLTNGEYRKEIFDTSSFGDSFENSLNEFNISSKKFKSFIVNNLQKWIGFKLLPEIVELNMVGLNSEKLESAERDSQTIRLQIERNRHVPEVLRSNGNQHHDHLRRGQNLFVFEKSPEFSP